ncbi:unknown [Roseburia sp. CAG:380]|nr:unknown [Roseburia sp. CAG:380]
MVASFFDVPSNKSGKSVGKCRYPSGGAGGKINLQTWERTMQRFSEKMRNLKKIGGQL